MRPTGEIAMSNPTQAAAHLNAVDWSLAYYEQTSSNPDYEILTPFGAYTAARMNAEHGRNYDVQKFVKWVFDRSNARHTTIMISGEQWGGEDVGGLMGFTVPNTGNPRARLRVLDEHVCDRHADGAARAVRGPLQSRDWQMDAQCGECRPSVLCRCASAAEPIVRILDRRSAELDRLRGAAPPLAHSQFDGEELYAAGDPAHL